MRLPQALFPLFLFFRWCLPAAGHVDFVPAGATVIAGAGSPESTRPAESNSEWTAQWIGLPLDGDRSPRNQWIRLRGEFDWPGEGGGTRARIAVDSRYWLWLNGRRVVYAGGLKRGPTPRDTYYEEVDLAPALREGRNQVSVLVWHFGRHGFSHKSSGRAGFLFELDGGRATSGGRWRASAHPAYGDPLPFEPAPNYRLPESNVRYDARLADEAWARPEFDDSGWPAAVELGRPPCAPWNELRPRRTPQWRISELRDFVSIEERPFERDASPLHAAPERAHAADEVETSRDARDGTPLQGRSESEERASGPPTRVLVAHLPRNLCLHPWLRVRAPAGATIDFYTDNYEGGGERNLRHQYVTRDGEQEYEALAYLNGHALVVELSADVEVLDLRFRESRYDSDVVGSFECEDPALMRLREKALATLPLNLRDAIQDPDRERAQWWGDAVNALPQLYTTHDARAHLLVAKAIRNLVDWQRADGSLYAPVPTGVWKRELPLQMLASVGEFGVARAILYSGDLELLAEVHARLARYLDLWTLGDDDLVVRRPGEWTWVDWGRNKDVPLGYDAWYHLALRGGVRMAEWSGELERADALRALLARHRTAFGRQYWRDGAFRSPGHAGPPDDRGNALAVLAGLAPESARTDLERLLLRQRHASPYMERFVLEALFDLGDGSSALRRMRQRFAPMIASESTTLWERWSLDPRSSSYDHAWSGSPLHLLPERVAGVRPLEPGYRRFEIAPKLGDLQSVRACVPTPHGDVRVRLERRAGRLELDLDVPPGCEAELGLPPPADGRWDRVTIDGVELGDAAGGSGGDAATLRSAPAARSGRTILSAGRHHLRADG